MIQLNIEFDYIVGDTQEWLDDMTTQDKNSDRCTVDFENWAEDTFQANPVEFFNSIGATSFYGENPVSGIFTEYYDNYLSSDIRMVYAESEKYGRILAVAWQYSNTYEFYKFLGDGTEWLGFDKGYASCSAPCSTEWIIERACKLWRNGGYGATVDIADTIRDGKAYCPDCGSEMTFWTE